MLAFLPRRVGRAPHCRRCNFDLSGINTTAEAAACPECGRPLAAPRAIATGRRAPRPRVAIAAALAFLLAAFPIAAAVLASTSISPANKPTFWLIWETSNAPSTRADAAATELLVRRSANKLTNAQLADLIPAMLRVQADPTAFWKDPYGPQRRSPWPDVLIEADTAGLLTPEHRRAILQHAVAEWSMPTARRLLRGVRERTTIEVPSASTPIRTPSGSVFLIPRVTAATINGRPAEPVTHEMKPGFWLAVTMTEGPNGSTVEGPNIDRPIGFPPSLVDLPVGQHQARITWTIEIYDPARNVGEHNPFITAQVGPPDATVEFIQNLTISVYETPADALRLLTRADLPPGTAPPTLTPQIDTTTKATIPWSVQPLPEWAKRNESQRDQWFLVRPTLRRPEANPTAGPSTAGAPASGPNSEPNADAAWLVGYVTTLSPTGEPINFDGSLNDEPRYSIGFHPPEPRSSFSHGLYGFAYLPNRPTTLTLTLVPDPEHAVRSTEAQSLWNEPIEITAPLDWSAVDNPERP